jgi:hypothetical protein
LYGRGPKAIAEISLRYAIGLTRFLCNPAGYNGKNHNPGLTVVL